VFLFQSATSSLKFCCSNGLRSILCCCSSRRASQVYTFSLPPITPSFPYCVARELPFDNYRIPAFQTTWEKTFQSLRFFLYDQRVILCLGSITLLLFSEGRRHHRIFPVIDSDSGDFFRFLETLLSLICENFYFRRLRFFLGEWKFRFVSRIILLVVFPTKCDQYCFAVVKATFPFHEILLVVLDEGFFLVLNNCSEDF
jgi:hypothetical protein